MRFAFTLPFLQVNQKLKKKKKKTHTCTKVIHSLVHPFNRTRVRLEVDRDHLFSCVSVRLFGAHLSEIAAPINLVQSNQTRQMWIHPYSDKDPDFKASQSDWSLPFLSIIESFKDRIVKKNKTSWWSQQRNRSTCVYDWQSFLMVVYLQWRVFWLMSTVYGKRSPPQRVRAQWDTGAGHGPGASGQIRWTGHSLLSAVNQ